MAATTRALNRRAKLMEIAHSVLDEIHHKPVRDHRPPMWMEGRIAAEYLSLIADPVYRGHDLPRGNGRPVMVIPGFLAGDWTLFTPVEWLRRMGYRAGTPGIFFNVFYSEVIIRNLLRSLRDLYRQTRTPVALVGHSRGGVLAKVLSHRNPSLVEQVITLGSPLLNPFDVHPVTMAGVRVAHALNVFRYGHAASVEMRFLRDLAATPKVPTTSVYSRTDGIVDWHACVRADVNCIEVRGSHIGLVTNPEVYRILGHMLPAPWKA